MNFDEWLKYGIENGFCSGVVCATHDGVPTHETEDRAWDEGSDPCATIVRLGTPSEWELPDWWFEQ
jgi:hypothetical protein